MDDKNILFSYVVNQIYSQFNFIEKMINDTSFDGIRNNMPWEKVVELEEAEDRGEEIDWPGRELRGSIESVINDLDDRLEEMRWLLNNT